MNSLKHVPSASQRPAVRERAAGGRRGGVDRAGHIVRRIVEDGGAPGPDQVIRLQGALGNRQIARLVEGGVPAHGVTVMRQGPVAAVADAVAGAERTGAQAPAAMRILWFNSVVLPVSEARDALMAKRPDVAKAIQKVREAGRVADQISDLVHDSGDHRLGFRLGRLAEKILSLQVAMEASKGIKRSLTEIAGGYLPDEKMAEIGADIIENSGGAGTPGGETRSSVMLLMWNSVVAGPLRGARDFVLAKPPNLRQARDNTATAHATVRELSKSFEASGNQRLQFRLAQLMERLNVLLIALGAYLGVKHSPAGIAADFPPDEKLVEVGSELR